MGNSMKLTEPYLGYFAAACDEFHNMGVYEENEDLNHIIRVYREYLQDPESFYKGPGLGIIYHDPNDSLYDQAEVTLVRGRTICTDELVDVAFLQNRSVLWKTVEEIQKAFPDFKFTAREPLVQVMYCEEEWLFEKKTMKITELDKKIEELDKRLSGNQDSVKEEPKEPIWMYFTVYYAVDGEMKKLQEKITIGDGKGGICQHFKETVPCLKKFCKEDEEKAGKDQETLKTELQNGKKSEPSEPQEPPTPAAKISEAKKETKSMVKKTSHKSIHERLEINKRILREKQAKESLEVIR